MRDWTRVATPIGGRDFYLLEALYSPGIGLVARLKRGLLIAVLEITTELEKDGRMLEAWCISVSRRPQQQ